MTDINDRLNAAAAKAEAGSQTIHEFANADADTDVPTESGPIPSLAKIAKKFDANLGGTVDAAVAQQSSVSPQPDKIPRAGASGKIDLGWLPGSMATLINIGEFPLVDSTGVNDSTTGLQAAVNSGAPVLTGKGVITFSSTIYIPIGTLIDGLNQLQFRYNGPAGTDAFVFVDATSGFKQLSGIRNCRITTTVRGRYAITTPKSTNAWNRQYRFDFTGLYIHDDNQSLTIALNYWDVNLNIGDCRALLLTQYQFVGGWKATDTNGTDNPCKGLLISAAVGAIGITISDGACTSMSHAWDLSDGVEGHEMHGNEAVSCWDGLTYSNAGEEPGGFVHNNHFNCSHRGIVGRKRVELNIGANSYYRAPGLATHSAGWSAIELSECNFKVTIGAVHAVPGSATAVPDSYALRFINCAATFLRVQDFDLSLQMTGAVFLDSVSGLRMQGGSARGMNEFCRVQNTYFSTTDIKMTNIDASNSDASLLVTPAGFSTAGIFIDRSKNGALNSPASLSINASSDFTINPKAGLTTISISGTSLTANVILSKVGASARDKILLKFVNSGTAGHTISFLNGAAGPVLNIIRSGSAVRYNMEYEFNGTNWVCNGIATDLDATLRT